MADEATPRTYPITRNAENLAAELLALIPEEYQAMIAPFTGALPDFFDALDDPDSGDLRKQIVAKLRDACQGLEPYGIIIVPPGARPVSWGASGLAPWRSPGMGD